MDVFSTHSTLDSSSIRSEGGGIQKKRLEVDSFRSSSSPKPKTGSSYGPRVSSSHSHQSGSVWGGVLHWSNARWDLGTWVSAIYTEEQGKPWCSWEFGSTLSQDGTLKPPSKILNPWDASGLGMLWAVFRAKRHRTFLGSSWSMCWGGLEWGMREQEERKSGYSPAWACCSLKSAQCHGSLPLWICVQSQNICARLKMYGTQQRVELGLWREWQSETQHLSSRFLMLTGRFS
jgi:hypothetical protein